MLRLPGSAGERFGTVLRERRAGDFLLRESRYGPERAMPMVAHPNGYFCVVVEGAVRERRARDEHIYEPGSVHYHTRSEPHAARAGAGGARCLSIVVADSIASRLDALARVGRDQPRVPASAALVARCCREFHACDSASDLALESLALEMATVLVRRAPGVGPAPAWLACVRDYLHAHFAEHVALADLAGVAGVHPVHLVRAFRRHVGRTPGAYMRELRIEAARTALARTDRTLADIALEAGFAHQPHFTRVFRRVVGVPPGQYRRLIRGPAIPLPPD